MSWLLNAWVLIILLTVEAGRTAKACSYQPAPVHHGKQRIVRTHLLQNNRLPCGVTKHVINMLIYASTHLQKQVHWRATVKREIKGGNVRKLRWLSVFPGWGTRSVRYSYRNKNFNWTVRHLIYPYLLISWFFTEITAATRSRSGTQVTNAVALLTPLGPMRTIFYR